MTNYNPFTASVTAVISEVTSDNAKAYYASRALEDIDRVITVCEAVYAIASMVYELGAICGEAHYSAVSETFTAPVEAPKALPAVQPIAALPPAKPRKHNTVEAPVNGVIVPDFSIADAPIQNWLTDTSIAAKAYATLSKKALLKSCADKGLKVSKRLRKDELIDLLVAA